MSKWQALGLGLGLVAVVGGCVVVSPVPGPEARCTDACRATASACQDWQCARGCRFVLDKLVEREGANVLACVAKAKPACSDHTFADCAVRTGPNTNGGPPPPKPPSDEDE
jgi:hypothetical protein